ncbi:hypothetical protein EJB05_47816, partial [Eragrostis curvula]
MARPVCNGRDESRRRGRRRPPRYPLASCIALASTSSFLSPSQSAAAAGRRPDIMPWRKLAGQKVGRASACASKSAMA